MKWTRAIFGLSAVLFGLIVFAASASLAAPPDLPVEVLRPVAFDVSPPLRDIKPIEPVPGIWPRHPHTLPPGLNQPVELPTGPPGPHVLQDKPAPPLMPAPLATFVGIGNGMPGYSVAAIPPDTEGDIGPNQYVQWVNSHFVVFDRAGTVLYGPAAGNTLWTGFGGRCESDNNGDPIVQYDQFADRWVMTQFAISASPYYQCVAVSTSGDPTGSYYRWAYSFGSNMNDYPKFGVWNDGYYATYNMFAGGATWAGGEVCAYNRTKMLAGDAGAETQCFGPYSAYGGWLPADLDGTTLAPAGSPNYILAFGTNSLLFWKFHVDWTTPANSTFTGPTTIAVAAFNEGCGGGTCLPQSGTTNELDSLADRLMYRLAYRNFSDHESLVVNHSINTSVPIAVRWYELRSPATTPTVYQSGTYQPDTMSRWMGSAAMDHDGNLAIGYSRSASTAYPSLWYAGRLVGDVLGTLAQGEALMHAGGGSQTGYSRWGDYSTLSIDPVDDCTFWYTNEFLTVTHYYDWSTRVGTFRFFPIPAVQALTATANGNNRIDLSWGSVSGVGAYFVNRATTSGGPYSTIATVTPPTTTFFDTSVDGGLTYYYMVSNDQGKCKAGESLEATATAAGACSLAPGFAGLASVSSSGTAACGLSLSWAAATAPCGGAVSYSVYRSTSSGFTPGLVNRIASGLTGTSITDSGGLISGTTYYYIVRATDEGNGVEDSNAVERSGSPMGASSYQYLYGPESFDALADGVPASWALGFFSGDAADWRGVRTCTAHSGAKIFRYGGNAKCTANYANSKHALARPPAIVVPAGSSNVRLSFWHRWQFEAGYDGGYLRISLDGTTYTIVTAAAILSGPYNGTFNSGTVAAWNGTQATFVNTVADLDAACNMIVGNTGGCAGKTIYIGFTAYTDSSVTDYGWFIDDVQVTADVAGACGTAPNPVQFFTARATSGTTLLEWQNPAAGSYGAGVVRVRTDGTFPTSVSDGVGVTCGGQNTALSGYNSCTHSGVNGTTYSYSLFVDNGAGVVSSKRTVTATPFDTTGARKWAYSTGAASLAPTGIRPGAVAVGAVYDVANDRVLHAMNPTGAGGSWPRTAPYGWMPLGMNAPAQHRPPIVPLAAGPRVFLASQDGYAYAVNAQTGALVWTSPLLGDVLQANPAGLFSDLVPTAPNLLFVGTRNATSANTLYALNPNTGAVVTTFDNGGGATAIGIITGLAVDYTGNLVYFTSRAAGGGSSDTVWCLSTTGGVLAKVWSAALGDIDGAPVLYSGRLYLGTNSGQVLAVDAATHATVWTYPTGDGPVKGFVTPAFGTSPLRLYLATTTTVWALDDLGGAASLAWSNAALPSPSTPLVLFGTTSVLIGAGNGTLYQLGTASGAVTGSVSLGSTALGSPSFDVTNSLAHVGSTAGVVHAVVAPLP